MVIPGRFKDTREDRRRPLPLQEAHQTADPFFRISKYLMERGAIATQARYIELRLADVDTDAQQGQRMLSHMLRRISFVNPRASLGGARVLAGC